MAGYDAAERRSKPRLAGPFPVTIYGDDARGEDFEVSTVADNISAGGLYLRLGQRIEPGTTLFIIIRLSTSGRLEGFAPRFALRGVVVRAELKAGGTCGVAVAFSRHRSL